MNRGGEIGRTPVIVLALLLLAFPGAARAVSEEVQLPLRAVTLYTSGVGHFAHSGEVSGPADIAIAASRAALDDMLKTLTVEDISGGTVRAVNYTVSDPLSRGLAGLPLHNDATLLTLLQGMIGEEVAVGTPATRGTLMAAQPGAAAESGPVVMVTLLTAEGLQSIGLGADSRISIEDAALQAQLAAALGLIKAERSTDWRTLLVRTEGGLRRTVRAGYLRETPVWKATYRLVIGDHGEPLLQGWALVENPTDQDWDNISLTLVAGDPVSFRMPLAAPLYRERPYAGFPLSDLVRPPQYADPLWGRGGAEPPAAATAPERRSAVAEMSDGFTGRGVQSAAEVQTGGSFARYVIKEPVSISAASAAMVPIVQRSVPAELVSVYDPQTHPSLPLAGVQLTNSGGAALSAGPIVVYEDGGYAGEAVLRHLAEDDSRLLTFSLDQRTEVSRRTDSAPERVTRVQIDRGVMTTTTSLRREHRYVVSSRDATARTLLIQHRREGDWRLVVPKEPDQEYSDGYRFRLTLDARGSRELLVVEERARRETVSLSTVSAERIQLLLSQRQIPADVRDALARIRTLQSDLAAAREQRRAVEQHIGDIYAEQERIRANMAALDHAADLYRRYVNELTTQEDRLAELQGQLRRARSLEQQQSAALERFIGALIIE